LPDVTCNGDDDLDREIDAERDRGDGAGRDIAALAAQRRGDERITSCP
jgi:hypothetical protein